eukprot:9394490-Karenia_brevis.AAC.1
MASRKHGLDVQLCSNCTRSIEVKFGIQSRCPLLHAGSRKLKKCDFSKKAKLYLSRSLRAAFGAGLRAKFWDQDS